MFCRYFIRPGSAGVQPGYGDPDEKSSFLWAVDFPAIFDRPPPFRTVNRQKPLALDYKGENRYDHQLANTLPE